MLRESDLVDRVHRRALRDLDATDIERLARTEAQLLPDVAVAELVAGVRARTHGLGPLEPVLADPAVSEVMVNGPGRPVWIERLGCLHELDVALDAPSVDVLVERIVGPLGLRADRTSPLVDARLADGSRVNVAMPPLAVDGPYVTIRRFVRASIALDELATPEQVEVLTAAVARRANIVVTGGTGAGKTTLLNALAALVPAGERVVTVEDAAELQLGARHVVRLEARPANAEGAGEIRIRDLVRNALRMRPDRIVVGEVRGEEAIDMVQAMNTGHDGSLSTCHANSTADALRRIEAMVLSATAGLPIAALREQVASAVDLVVEVSRVAGGGRAVTAVDEVVPLGDLAGEQPLRVRPVRELAEVTRPWAAR